MTQVEQFVARLNSDKQLRRRVEEAEQKVAARTEKVKAELGRTNRENLEALKAIAAEYGFDLTLDETGLNRFVTPSHQQIENACCLLTCCWVETSVWDTEGLTAEGPGCMGSTRMSA
ncbi:Nif11-like leader peptide family natural product precursor [Kitasatospora sp. NPDC094011]|uniref:Nif11-like leader peptide family natural product precursor n=1 Tax=Kitasatospora sp. NPDC094011 TaxID=3364090 RepID=UPI00382E4CCE